MAEMKNLCGKIPVELHEKVRAEIEESETSTQIFIRQVIEEHFNRLENKGEPEHGPQGPAYRSQKREHVRGDGG